MLSLRRGRPIKRPTSALGRQITARLEVLNLPTQVLAHRLGVSRATVWRLLHAKTRFSSGVDVAVLCRVLELEGERRDLFVQACVQDGIFAAHDHSPSYGPPMPALSGGEQAGGSARQEIGQEGATRSFRSFTELLQGAGVSQAELARQAGVAPSTVCRLLRGHTKRTHKLAAHRLATLLESRGVDRRTFLILAFETGLFALTTQATGTTPASAATPRFLPLEKSLGATFAEVEEEIRTLRDRRTQGDVATVFSRAQELFHQLFDFGHHAGVLKRSPELARTKLAVGLEYCEAQAAALGWYERGPHMVRTLDRMLQEVLQQFPFPPRPFASEYGHLLNLRAPLYRMMSHANSLQDAYRESIWEFTFALDQVMPHVDEPTLRIELLRNRAHVGLLSGDTARWTADLQQAGRIALGLRGEVGETHQAMVTYSWGEGYKRLASRPELAEGRQTQYVRDARDALHAGEAIFGQHAAWQGYALLARIAAASVPDMERARTGDCRRAAVARYRRAPVPIAGAEDLSNDTGC